MNNLRIRFSDSFLLTSLFVFSILGFAVFSNFPELFRLPRATVYLPRLLVLASALFLIFISMKNYKNRQFNLSIILFLTFWLFYSVRIFYDLAVSDIRMNRSTFLYLNFAYGITFIPALAILFTRTKDNFFKNSELSLILLGSFCIFSALYMGGIWESDGRLSGNSFQNPIGLGNVACTLCLLILNKCFDDYKPLFKLPGLLLIFLFICSFDVLISSGSRGPILAFFLISLLLITVRLHLHRQVLTFIFLSIMFIIIFGPSILEFLTGFEGGLIGRFSVLYVADKFTSDERYILAIDSYNFFKSSPLIGVGVDLPGRGYPHNIFIEGFTSLGIFGGLLLGFIICRGIFLSLKLLKSRTEIRWASLLYFQYLLGALLSGTIYDNNQFWITLALICSINSIQLNKSVVNNEI